MKRYFYRAIGVIAIFLGATFVLKNPQAIAIHYYFGIDLTAPVSLVLITVFFVGVLVAYLFGWLAIVRLRRELRRVRKEKDSLQKELDKVQAQPNKIAV